MLRILPTKQVEVILLNLLVPTYVDDRAKSTVADAYVVEPFHQDYFP